MISLTKGVRIRLKPEHGIVTVEIQDRPGYLDGMFYPHTVPAISTQRADAIARKALPGARLLSTGGTRQLTRNVTRRIYTNQTKGSGS